MMSRATQGTGHARYDKRAYHMEKENRSRLSGTGYVEPRHD